MFVVNRSPAATPIREVTAPASSSPTATPSTPAAPSNQFGVSTFEASAPRNAPTPYAPTLAQLDRPTTATVLNITNGERQPLNPAQMSTEQGASFIQGRLQALGYSGPGQVANTSLPTTGPFRMDYGTDDRRHWDIDGINVGLAERLYANNPPEVADRMLALDMQHARRTSWNDDDGQTSFASQPAATPPMRLVPGTNIAAQLQQAQIPRGTTSPATAASTPTREPLNRFVARGGDAFTRSELEKKAAGSRATAQYSEQVNAALLADPRIKATYEGLKALGYQRFLPDVGQLFDVFSTTELEPEDLLKHYGLLIQSRGGDENRVAAGGHGAEFRNMAEGLAPRLREGLYGKPAWSTDADAANPVKPSARPESQWKGVAFDPLERAGVARSGPKSYDAQQAKWDRTFGKAKRRSQNE